MGRSEQQVTVAVPLYRSRLTPDEEISWRHLRHYLGHLDIRLVLPEGLESPLPEVPRESFPAPYFENVASYSRLLLGETFYRRFQHAEFLLIYQLDALVFSDRLAPWCEAGYDYLGAPWWKDPAEPSKGLSRTGNGGLSLRRVESCLRVLTADGDGRGTAPRLRGLLGAPLPDLEDQPAPERLYKRLGVLREARRGAGWYAEHYSLNEDHFWSDRARLFDPDFRLAPAEEALGFAFEIAPREAFRRNGGRLPFGCHGWWRYDREFWQPHLLPAGGTS